jgi:hypothetical protein
MGGSEKREKNRQKYNQSPVTGLSIITSHATVPGDMFRSFLKLKASEIANKLPFFPLLVILKASPVFNDCIRSVLYFANGDMGRDVLFLPRLSLGKG